ncbi:MAG: SagB/ThcOx family dehydrogenase [Arenicellales bacterium]
MTTRVQLPAPSRLRGLAGLLMTRRSVREYDGKAVSLVEMARLLWSGQGVSHSSGKRTTPSPHGLNPLSLYLVAGDVTGLNAGLYLYESRSHTLAVVGYGDLRTDLYHAALEDQPWIESCAALIVIAGDVGRAEKEFAAQPPDGRRGRRYTFIEAGAAAQGIALRAVEMDLGTVLVGGFDDDEVKQCLKLRVEPLVMIPVGRLPQ